MDFVERVRSSVDIVSVIGERVALRPAGPNRFRGPCTFHGDAPPSFSVHARHQYFKCFSCGAGGDVLKYVMLSEGMTFNDALRSLAMRHGIPIPEDFGGPEPESKG